MSKHRKHRRHHSEGAPRRRPTKSEVLAHAVVQDVINLSTPDIQRKRTVIQCELDAVESEISEGLARLALLRQKREKIGATLMGLGWVIDKRQVCE